jgi:hypothetical protein
MSYPWPETSPRSDQQRAALFNDDPLMKVGMMLYGDTLLHVYVVAGRAYWYIGVTKQAVEESEREIRGHIPNCKDAWYCSEHTTIYSYQKLAMAVKERFPEWFLSNVSD